MSTGKIVVIRNEIKITPFLFDAFNTFVTQLVIVTNGDNETNKYIIGGVIGILYVAASVFQYFWHLRSHYRVHKDDIKDNDNWERLKFVTMCILNLFFVLGSISCFFGDNLHIFGDQDQKAGIASVSLLFIGLIGFRLIPAIKDEINNLFEDKEDADDDDDEEDPWTLWNKTVDILQLAPEIDGWFTHFAALVFVEQTLGQASSCGAVSFICIFIIILASLPVFLAIGHLKMISAKDRKPEKWFQLVVYIFMFIIVVLSLIGDNSQPLDCWSSKNCSFEITTNNSSFLIDDNTYNNFTFMDTQALDCSDNKAANIVRIIFSALTFIIYSVLLIIARITVICNPFEKIKEWWDKIKEWWDEKNIVTPLCS
uniref:Uncharacterized protein n=1 Tax=Amphimedon queenslandica TaxID=400682 RepID=A0A1X7VLJ7_AMPQE